MGEEPSVASAPLRFVIEDLGAAQAVARRMLRAQYEGQELRGIAVGYYLIGALNLALVTWRILAHDDPSRWWLQAVTGCFFLLSARLHGSRMPPLVPTEFAITGDGIAYSVRGRRAHHTSGWKDVRSVVRCDAGFVVTLGPFTRAIVVPSFDAALMDDAWTRFYDHLVARRGLRPTPLDRLRVLHNSNHATTPFL